MTDLIIKIKTLKTINMVILCIKLDSKIDIQFKYTLQYYVDIFDGSLNNNMFLCITNVPMDFNSITLKKLTNVDLNKNVDNIQNYLKEILSINHRLTFTFINSIPIDAGDIEQQCSIRKIIFDKLKKYDDISTVNLKVVKTKEIFQEDENEYNKNIGIINGYKDRLIKEKAEEKETFEILQRDLTELSNLRIKKYEHETRLNKLDSPRLIIVGVWNAEVEWQLLRWLNKKYDLTSNIKIINYDRTSYGFSHFKDNIKTSYHLKGVLEGDFMRELYADIESKTHSYKFYERDINDLKEKIKILEAHISSKNEKYSLLKSIHSKLINEIKDMEDKNNELEKLNLILKKNQCQ